jgi:hypothetical protein
MAGNNGADAQNLVMGPGTLYLADFDAAEPADADVASPPSSAVWYNVGGTLGGITVNFNQTYTNLAMDQVVDVAGRRLTERDVQFQTQMAENTFESLRYALNDGEITTGSGFRVYEPAFTDSATQPSYRALILDGWAPGAAQQRRRFVARRVLSIAAVGIPYSKDGQAVIPVTFGAHYVNANTVPYRVIDEYRYRVPSRLGVWWFGSKLERIPVGEWGGGGGVSVVVVMFEPGMEKVENRAEALAHAVTEAVYEDSVRFCPVDTTTLARSIRREKLRRKGRVWVGTNYWAAQEYGAVPHVIMPKGLPGGKKALWWPGLPHPVGKVNHPGNAAQPFMRPALYRRRQVLFINPG